MQFEWGEAKNAINISKHGVDFEDAKEIFNHPMMTLVDDREDYDEERWLAVGLLHAMFGVVVYTERVGDVVRIISARKATKNEVCRYEKAIKN